MTNYEIAVLLACVLFLAGCATPTQPYWQKNGVTEKETRDMYAECRYEIGMQNMPTAKENELLQFCMERHGFRLSR